MPGQRVEGVVRGAGTDAVDEGLGLWIAVLRREGTDTCGRRPGDLGCHVTPFVIWMIRSTELALR